MGSPLRLHVVDAPPALGDAAWAAVDAEFEAAEQAMSRFRPSSDLTAANRRAGTGERTVVNGRLRRALVAAARAGRVTGGRFDARVLEDLERLGERGTPSDVAAASSGGRACWSGSDGWLEADPRRDRVRLAAPVDLGGIGKGLALRWAWRLAQAILPPGAGALLEAGGDLVASIPSPDDGPWRIGIEDPTGGSEPLAVIAHARGAVATSSVAVRRWIDPRGRAVHHLIDPATGEPGGAGLLAVTVAASDPAWAEVWSKTLFLEGRARIADAARARGFAAWWVTEAGGVEMTPAARERTLWSTSDRRAG